MLLLVLISKAGLAQLDATLSLDLENESLQGAIRKIQRNTDVVFAYDADELKKVNVSGSWKNKSLKEVLPELLRNTGYTYQLVGTTIAIVPTEVEDQSILQVQQRSIAVSGKVLDAQTGESLPFSNVRIEGTALVVQTDADGRFSIPNVPSDTCKLLVDYVGYTRYATRLNKLGWKTGVKVLMNPGKVFLPSAVIEDLIAPAMQTGDQPGMAGINPRALGATYASGEADVMRAVQLIPGVNGTSENNGGLVVRGSDADQTLVAFDGFTVYHLDHFFGTFGSLNAHAVKNMQVYKGFIPSRFGGRSAGVLEVIGKQGNNQKLSGGVDFGPLALGVHAEGPLNPKKTATMLIAYRRSITDWYSSNAYTQLFNTVYNQGAQVSTSEQINSFQTATIPQLFFQDFTAKITLRAENRDNVQLSTFLSGDRLKLTYADTSSALRFSGHRNNRSDWGNKGASLRWLHVFHDSLSLVTTAGLSAYSSNFTANDTILDRFFNASYQTSSNDEMLLSDFTLRSELEHRKGNSKFNYGLQLTSIGIQHFMSITGYADYSWQAVADSSERGQIIAFYGERNWKTPRWNWTSGLRLSSYSSTRKFYPEWRIAGVKTLSESSLLKFALMRTHQFIHRIYAQSILNYTSDLWQLSDGNNLPVLRSDFVSVGFEYKQKMRWKFDVESYVRWNQGTFEYLGPYQNVLPTIGQSALPIAVGNGMNAGIDFLMQYHYGRWNIWGGYTLLRAFNKLEGFGSKKIPERLDQRHELKANVQYAWKKWESSAVVLWSSGRPYTKYYGSYEAQQPNGEVKQFAVFSDLNGARLPAYFRLDVTLARTWKWGQSEFCLRGAVLNVLNSKNVRDIRYFSTTGNLNNADVMQRTLVMQRRMPTIQIQWTF
jgi:outer membrane receptor for ferrienterochelin and colicin